MSGPDLFGNVEAPPPPPRDTLFGEGIDTLARALGAWPADAVAYAAEVVNENQVLLTGAVPDGYRRDGRPKFPRKPREYKAVATKDQYREAIRPAGAI